MTLMPIYKLILVFPNLEYPQKSGEQYRTNGPLIIFILHIQNHTIIVMVEEWPCNICAVVVIYLGFHRTFHLHLSLVIK